MISTSSFTFVYIITVKIDLSGIQPPVMNWDASNLPEEWQKLHVSFNFLGPLKAKTEEEHVSY